MYTFAHIGKIPVEEWLPFVVPVVLLYLEVRRKERRRRRAVAELPGLADALDAPTVERVVARWSQANRSDLSADHVPLLYPPGPEGRTPQELARLTDSDPATVELLLEQLEELGYLTLEQEDGGPPRAALTIEGNLLQYDTEAVILERAGEQAGRPRADS